MKRLWIIGVVVLLAGCGSLLPKPSAQPTLCVLQPVETFPSTALPAQPVAWHLSVDIPSGGASYDTSQVPIMRKSHLVEYFSGIEWTDRLPILLQNLMLKSFENTGKIMGISRASAGINPDKMLMVDIRQCHVSVKEQTPQVDVSLMVKLVDMKDRRILASTVVSSSTPLAIMDPALIVKGFQKAVNDVIQQVVTWTLRGAEMGLPPQSSSTPKAQSA